MDIKGAVIAVSKAKTVEERKDTIGKYLNEVIDLSDDGAVTELHQRAIFMSELRVAKLWPPDVME